ncbi:MAG: hypothetical protein OWS74_03295, partial [Firmicutes bacterium]|nr:hypothetical protein [Bacillota bacterium]
MAKDPENICGFWPSFMTPERMVELVKVFDVQWDRRGKFLVIFEKREGQSRLLRVDPSSGFARDLLSTNPVAVRVNYGGGEYTVGKETVYFVSRGRLNAKPLADGMVQILTRGKMQPAAPALSPDERWVAFVYDEKETEDGIAVAAANGSTPKPQKLMTGYDFFMQPVWSADGRYLAAVAWNHPAMPWDAPVLLLAELDYAVDHPEKAPKLMHLHVIAGPDTGMIFQPEFSPNGRFLAYVAEVDNWTQLFVKDLQNGITRQLTHHAAELAMPAWRQGVRTIGWHPDSAHLYYIVNEEGRMSVWKVAVDDPHPKCLTTGLPFDVYRQIAVDPQGTRLAMRAVATNQPERIIVLEDNEEKSWHVVRYTTSNEIAPALYSRARPVHWGEEGDLRYGLYYAPAHPQYTASG